jgi:glucosamine-6-phosphate deaminase
MCLIDEFRVDLLHVHLYRSRREMAKSAAVLIATEIRSLISERKRAIGIFASDPSHSDFLDELVCTPDLEWTRVIGFHLDEYLDIEAESPQSFRRFLLDQLVKRVPIAEFHPIRGEAVNPEAVCANYSALLKSRPPDFAVLGIGENGCLGLLNAPDCDFNDAAAVKILELDRDQQGASRAISLTIPTIMSCRSLFAIVPGRGRQEAINRIIEGEIGPACSGTFIRTHPNAHLFLESRQ